MDVYSLKLFLEAARTCNFTKVVENFYTTQPAVTRRIKVLEKELGYKLFTRQNPDCGFEILRMFSTQIRKSLSEGNFDIYIGEESDIIVDDSWEKTIIKSNPLGLIVRKNENLDSLSEIKKFILEHHVFLLPEEDAPAMTRLSRKLLNSYGADFSLCEEISPVESIMFNIASGIGYSFLPENNVF